MSFFGKLFGVKKEEKGPSTEDAIQKLRSTEEMLIKKQEFLEKKIEQEVAIAKKNGTTNKRGKLTSKVTTFPSLFIFMYSIHFDLQPHCKH